MMNVNLFLKLFSFQMNRQELESSIGTKNRQPPFITTKTEAYIFSLIIDTVPEHHNDCPYSCTLQLEATILKQNDSIIPDDFQAELSGAAGAGAAGAAGAGAATAGGSTAGLPRKRSLMI